MDKLKFAKYNDIEVAYLDELQGGGLRFGQQFIPIIKEKLGHVDHAFEYCAGAAFIGFSMMANKLCNKLTVADVNPEAVRVLNETIRRNGLESKVTAYLSDCLNNIPETEKWDLVVSSPPHIYCPPDDSRKKDIILFDPAFRIHRNFYRDIKKFLKPTGSILFQEHMEAHGVEDFRGMIEENGFKIVEVFTYKNPSGSPNDKEPDYSIYLKKPWRLFDPFHVYRFIKRRINPWPTRNYYFIWCKFK